MTAILAIIHNPAIERTARGVGAALVTQVAAPDFWPQLMSVLPPPYNLLAIPVLMGVAKALRMAFPDNAVLKYLPV